jgi:hypothetical protein
MRIPGLLLALVLSPPLLAAERLDDSASPQQRVSIVSRYLYEETSGVSDQDFHAVVAEARGVEVRLNTSKYVGRRAEIFLTLPLSARGLSNTAALRLDWRAQGRFSSAAGSLNPGGRALLYRGQIAQPQMIELFDFTVRMDERHVQGTIEFDPQFEIELLP